MQKVKGWHCFYKLPKGWIIQNEELAEKPYFFRPIRNNFWMAWKDFIKIRRLSYEEGLAKLTAIVNEEKHTNTPLKSKD